jgi:hypothetical protein
MQPNDATSKTWKIKNKKSLILVLFANGPHLLKELIKILKDGVQC